MHLLFQRENFQLLLFEEYDLEFLVILDYALCDINKVKHTGIVFYYTKLFNVFLLKHKVFADSICICLYRINWFYVFVTISTQGFLINFLSLLNLLNLCCVVSIYLLFINSLLIPST